MLVRVIYFVWREMLTIAPTILRSDFVISLISVSKCKKRDSLSSQALHLSSYKPWERVQVQDVAKLRSCCGMFREQCACAVAMWHRQTCAVWATGAHDSTPESILTVRARSVNQPPGTTSSHLPREIPVLGSCQSISGLYRPPSLVALLHCTGSSQVFRLYH